MKVQGLEIPQRVQDDAVAFIKMKRSFRSQDVQRMIDDHPLIETLAWKPAGLAIRVADRIIQRERKAGNIVSVDAEKARSTAWRWMDDTTGEGN